MYRIRDSDFFPHKFIVILNVDIYWTYEEINHCPRPHNNNFSTETNKLFLLFSFSSSVSCYDTYSIQVSVL